MRASIITSGVALSTALTLILAAPIDQNNAPTVDAKTLLSAVNTLVNPSSTPGGKRDLDGAVSAEADGVLTMREEARLPNVKSGFAADGLPIPPERKRDVKAREEAKKKKPHKNPYWCGAPFCKREIEVAATEKRSQELTKCWEAPDGQIHCQWAKRDEVVADITKCWEAPDGQIHCQWAKREAESTVADADA